ncbi:hypothetical protein B8V33_10360 [Streptococcus agalactiae]|nr:hypothetical protein B8V13_02075 [Streptococcus agalactiae]KAF1190201.1 hypothetical protein B8V33_10360 [Streptococcus agalactiae]KAF1258217.1 hypothetical protein B8V74_01490 [Streptococcus agalactiae]RKX12884.1 hypothetical protein D9A57_02835 [Streptococcus agalactiae]RKX16180.1 hypothetical protein D9A70_02840 [Streptococcus agalactiae]
MTLVRLLILKIIKRVFESYSKQRAMKISWLFIIFIMLVLIYILVNLIVFQVMNISLTILFVGFAFIFRLAGVSGNRY